MHPIFVDIESQWQQIATESAMLAGGLDRFGQDTDVLRDPAWRWLAVGGLASGVEKVYSGIERLLKLIATEIDGAVPTGEDWHRRLLTRMAAPLPGARPAVLSDRTFAALNALRAFRHRERNSYVAD